MFPAAKFVLVLCLLKQPHLAGKKSFFFLVFLCSVPPTRFCCFEVSYFTHHVILKACCRTLLVQSLLLCINSNQTMTQTNFLHSFYFFFSHRLHCGPDNHLQTVCPRGWPTKLRMRGPCRRRLPRRLLTDVAWTIDKPHPGYTLRQATTQRHNLHLPSCLEWRETNCLVHAASRMSVSDICLWPSKYEIYIPLSTSLWRPKKKFFPQKLGSERRYCYQGV